MVRSRREGRGRVGVVALLVLAMGLAACASRPAVPCVDVCAPAPAPCPPCDLPPEMEQGQVWCRVWVPPTYATRVDTVLVEPASSEGVWIPPRYGSRPKIVRVSGPQLREKVTPAVWAVKQQEVMVCPPGERWQRICCPPSELGPCEVQCDCWMKQETPGVFCKQPCPVCLAPERRCVEYTPARYKIVEERFLVTPGRCETVCKPAKYEQRCTEVCVAPGRWEWRRNESCEPPPPCVPAPPPAPTPLPGLQVEMQDSAETGEEAGVFAVGDAVRYNLTVLSDEGSQPLAGLHVVFTLPPELEFISGAGAGVGVTGSGQAAQSDPFDLGVGGSLTLHILCRVKGVPPTNLVQLTASIRDATGAELAVETESTTLKPAR